MGLGRLGTRAAWLVLLAWGTLGRAAGVADAACDGTGTVALLVSPRTPHAGGLVRVLAASDDGRIGDLVVAEGPAPEVTGTVRRLGGPPWSASLALMGVRPGTYELHATRHGAVVGCTRFEVGADDAPGWSPTVAGRDGGWDPTGETLYSAWIEHLFWAPPDEALAFDRLQDALADGDRNLLHDHLGLGEDRDPGALGAPPDCADLPYVLRAYFGWKLGLPLGFRPCSRGSATAAPACGGLRTEAPPASGAADWYREVTRRVMDTVHSGSARTPLGDDATDFYPVGLTRAALRPGTVYADPYGHTLVVVHWMPPTARRGGRLLAVDAQPDNSVARKRFWEGTFLFADDVASAGPGFKAFRPLVATRGGALAPLSNEELLSDPRFPPYSVEQALLTPEAFYARVGRLIDPEGLRPAQAYRETLDALVEQLATRVDSVQRGEAFMREHPGTIVAMPEGAAIFETIGPWEDYATPSRDLRLLIAMRVLQELPDRIVRHPELFLLDGLPPIAAAADVERAHADAVAAETVTYVRSDGTPWTLSVAEVLARRRALEMAYNPNDCVETRWGAPEGSAEHAPCIRRAPEEQRARMARYREWFRDGRRPSR